MFLKLFVDEELQLFPVLAALFVCLLYSVFQRQYTCTFTTHYKQDKLAAATVCIAASSHSLQGARIRVKKQPFPQTLIILTQHCYTSILGLSYGLTCLSVCLSLSLSVCYIFSERTGRNTSKLGALFTCAVLISRTECQIVCFGQIFVRINMIYFTRDSNV